MSYCLIKFRERKTARFALFFIGLVVSLTSYGQIPVQGKVTDNNNQPLAGVSVTEKGTSNGTTSSNGGTYSISVASRESILVFSYVGYPTQEISVGGRTSIDMQL